MGASTKEKVNIKHTFYLHGIAKLELRKITNSTYQSIDDFQNEINWLQSEVYIFPV